MQNDSDLRGVPSPQVQYGQNPGTQGIYSGVAGVNQPSYQPYSTGSKPAIGSLVMIGLTILNLIFLFISAGYAIGIFESLDTTSDGASFFITVLMTVFAGGLGLLCAFIGMRLGRLANSPVLVLVNKILFVSVIILSALVVIGPVFN